MVIGKSDHQQEDPQFSNAAWRLQPYKGPTFVAQGPTKSCLLYMSTTKAVTLSGKPER